MRAVDLFSGVGGMSLGFEKSGINILLAADNWQPALDVYEKNFDHPVANWDLSRPFRYIDEIRQLNPDIIIGGPPCQDFSHAGKRTEGERADLTYQFATIVGSVRPTWFVMENVERTLKSFVYGRAREVFKDSGYGLTEVVLNSALCKVPQKRKRFFCIGMLGANDGFLDEIIVNKLDTKEMTVRDYFGDEIDTENYYRHPRNYSRRAIYSIDEPSATIRGVNRPIPDGYPGHPGDSVAIDNNVRPLTTVERAMIQTFPKTFEWHGSKTNREQMIGNAVPVNLGKFVGECILEFSNSIGTITSDNVVYFNQFKEWLQQKDYSGRYLNDILSRLKRAIKIAGTYEPHNICKNKITEALKLDNTSTSVISQVKRSIDLYKEYRVESKAS